MVTHWESSKKPLYVKTIWKEGQHHVILNCQETSRQCRTTSIAQLRTVRSVKSAPSTNTNLKVSTVKLLENEESKSSGRCKTAGHKVRIKLTPKSSVKIVTTLNLAVETSINSVPLAVKSQSVDDCETNEVNLNETSFINFSKFVEAREDSLTDRVLMWLDLAIQTGNYLKPITIDPPLEVFSTKPIARRRHIFAKHRYFSSYHTNDYQLSKYTFQVEGVTQTLRTSDTSRSDFTTLGENVDTVDEGDEEDLVSSRLEENVTPENIFVTDKCDKKLGVKRQLHIFLPNLQKKTGFDDSVLNNHHTNDRKLYRSGDLGGHSDVIEI